MTVGNPDALGDLLLQWYDREKRELPWRGDEVSVYMTVVSEFMLQQTQVKTVLPYFDRWLQTFPDFDALANASIEEILKQWEGLGYYQRARNLHKTAQQYVAADAKPVTYDDWLAYPGVGPYMAAAISSIQGGDTQVVVDGNVIRVIARLFADNRVFKDAATAVKVIRPLAQNIMIEARSGDFNQALMELGATVCKKQKPLCLLCPWEKTCKARIQGIESEIPLFKKTKYTERTIHRLYAIEKGKLLLAKSSNGRRLDDIWELPELDGLPSNENPYSTKKRGIGNERITEIIYKSTDDAWLNGTKKAEHQWVPLKKLDKVLLSGPHRKWISSFLASDGDSC